MAKSFYDFIFELKRKEKEEMIKFEGLHKEFIQKKDCKMHQTPSGMWVWICPACENHNHFEFADERGDCKEIIYEDKLDKDGKLIQKCQCMCYSKEHK